jgi:hypothetical protein
MNKISARHVSGFKISYGHGRETQTRAAQVDYCKIGRSKISVIKQSIAQICSAEVGVIEPRMHKISARHVGGFKISCGQGRETQKGVV